MKTIGRSALAALALAFLALAPVAEAQDKPVVVVSASSLESLLDRVDYFSKLFTPPGQRLPIKQLAAGFTAGIDNEKPMGGVMSLGADGLPVIVAFVPVESLDEVINTMQSLPVPIEVEDAAGGAKRIVVADNSVIIKEQDGYAYIAQTADMLKNLPDPAKALGKLPEQFDLAVAVNVQNIPEDLRTFGFSFLEQALEAQLEQFPDESDEAFEQRRAAADMQKKQIKQLLEESEQILVGFAAKPQQQEVMLEFQFTAVQGTKLAQQIVETSDVQTQFASVLDGDSAALASLTQPITGEEQIEQASAQLEAAKGQLMQQIEESPEIESDEERQMFKEYASEALDILQGMIKGGKLDLAFNFRKTSSERFELVGGIFVPDAKRLQALTKKVLTMAYESEPNFPKPNFDIETYEGVTLHSLKIPFPDEVDAAETMSRVLGSDPMLYVGFSEDTMYLAAGTEALPSLKKVIDGAGTAKKVPPQQVVVQLLPILKLASAESEEVAMVAEALTEDSDAIRLISEVSAPTTSSTKFIIQEGVLKAIAKAAQQAQQAGGGLDEF